MVIAFALNDVSIHTILMFIYLRCILNLFHTQLFINFCIFGC
jgi:hypothetical protein